MTSFRTWKRIYAGVDRGKPRWLNQHKIQPKWYFRKLILRIIGSEDDNLYLSVNKSRSDNLAKLIVVFKYDEKGEIKFK